MAKWPFLEGMRVGLRELGTAARRSRPILGGPSGDIGKIRGLGENKRPSGTSRHEQHGGIFEARDCSLVGFPGDKGKRTSKLSQGLEFARWLQLPFESAIVQAQIIACL